MTKKEYAVFPVRAGTKGPWMVLTSSLQAEGIQAVRGKTMAEFNRYLADVIPQGVRVAVIDNRRPQPIMVTGRRAPDIAA